MTMKTDAEIAHAQTCEDEPAHALADCTDDEEPEKLTFADAFDLIERRHRNVEVYAAGGGIDSVILRTAARLIMLTTGTDGEHDWTIGRYTAQAWIDAADAEDYVDVDDADLLVAFAVERSKAELLDEHENAGPLDASRIRRFEDVHEVIDANELGGLCEDHGEGEHAFTDWIAYGEKVQVAVDEWIRSGGLHEAADLKVAHTFVATFTVPDGVEVDEVIGALIAQLEEVDVLPCGWTVDPDTVADYVDADVVIVTDANPEPILGAS